MTAWGRGIMLALRALLTRRVEILCDGVPYRYENVPYSKIANWILAELAVRFRPAKPWALPTHLQLEPTSLCNLRCALCPVTEGMGRPGGLMDLALFTRLIDEIGDKLFLILLWDWGEPFLHKQSFEMIAYARTKGIRVVSSTNGHMFADPENARALVRSGLDSIIFAVDGVTQETYQKYRQRGSLETVFSAIRTVAAMKRELNSATPLIHFRFIPMRHNEHEIPGLADLARSLGADALSLKKVRPDGGAAQSCDAGCDFLPLNPRYQRYRYSGGFVRLRAASNACRQLWNMPSVHWSGAVSPCCVDSAEDYVMGRLDQSSFTDIWRGESYAKMRRKFRSSWRDHRLCGVCSYAFQGGDLSTEIISDIEFFHSSPQPPSAM